MGAQLYFFWSGISLSVFYLFYLVFLKRETFFLLNRIYLLATLFLSMVIPLLHFSTLIDLPKMELMGTAFVIIGGEKLATVAEKEMNWLPIIYWTGVVFTAVLLLIKVLGVKRHIQLPEKGSAFSFWRTKVIDEELADIVAIDAHENVHIKQFHTLDMLLIELVNVFFWFNPILYCYRRSLKLIHEYLADEHAANFAGSKKQYAMLLFLQNFKAGPALTNTFYNPSLLEGRIKMLQRKKSSIYRSWKYVLCMPLIVLLMLMCSFNASDFSGDGTNNILQDARFPGKADAFSNYLKKETRKVSSENGRVIVGFIVEKNGEITNEKIETGLNEAANKEVLRVIHSSPRWNPARQNGKIVRSSYRIGINFVADNQLNKINN